MSESTEWIIARSANLAGGSGRNAFIEYEAEPSANILTYSSLMTAADCAAIDASAYEDARTWFLDNGSDPTMSGGASLGRSFELVATTALVSRRRAAFILRKIMERDGAAVFHLRGVGDEWRSAAVDLGARVVADDESTGPSPAPGARAHGPSVTERLLGRIVGLRSRSQRRTVILDTPRWSLDYDRALLKRGGVWFVNPGARVLADALLRQRSAQCSWLADASPGFSSRAQDLEVPSGELAGVRQRFESVAPALRAWAEAGRRLGGGGVVAVATQDVSPPARAFLLGLRAAGGRVITLEHGYSGVYKTQVYSIADVLAAWGEPQADYHRQAGPSGLDVQAVGWPMLERLYSTAGSTTSAAWDLVFFAQPSAALSSGDWPEDNFGALCAVEAYAEAHPNRRVAVKLHPATAAYGIAVPPMRHARTVSAGSASLIDSARLVAISLSTTGIEAMATGRPVIQFTRKGVMGPIEFISQSGAARAASGVADLEAAAESLLTDPAAYGSARDRGLAYAREFIRGVDHPGSAESRFEEIVQALRDR